MKTLLDAKYWDSVCTNTDTNLREENIAIYYKHEHIRLIKEWAGCIKGKRVLKTDLYEEAFGDGDFMPWILSQGADVFGLDISYKITKKAKGRLNGFKSALRNCVISDVRNCSFRNGSFDLIISNSTLDNLKSLDVPGALNELNRILKRDGIIILTLDSANNPLHSLGYLIKKLFKLTKFYLGKCYSVKESKNLAERNNFIVKDATAIVHMPVPFNKLVILLKRLNNKCFERLIRYCICLFMKLGNKKTKFLTGWYIALKLIKK